MSVVSLGSIAAATDLTITDNSPQLFFSDTSAPTYSWQIIADNNRLDIADETAITVPFHLSSGAPDFSINVASNGFIGLGTGNPVATLHVSTAELFPTLRLQSVDVGFEYIWEIEASAGGFSLIDVPNATIPFVVHTGAPDSSLYVNSAGNVGFGITSPTAPIHALKAAQPGVAETIARFEISDDSIGKLEIGNVSTGNGIFHPRLRGTTALQAPALTMEGLITADAGLNPVVAYDAALRAGGPVVTRPLIVYRNNGTAKVTIAANGNVTATSFITASSRDLKDKIAELSSDKAAAALRQLTPVEFVYRDDASAEPRVGFIAEDVPDLIAEPDRKSVPVMDVVALLTRVVKDQDRSIEQQQITNQRQQETIDQQQKLIAKQHAALAALTRRLDDLEQKIGK